MRANEQAAPGDILITPLRRRIPGAAIALTGVAAAAVALLLGIAGAVLGTQCATQGGQLGICPRAGESAVVSMTAAPAPTAASVDAAPPAAPSPALPAAPPAATAAPAKPAAPAAAPIAPPEAAAALSVHELIEASHGQLLLAQAERPLFGGSVGAEGEAGDGPGPSVAAPAQLAFAGTPARSHRPAPVATGRAAAPSIRAEFGTALPATTPSEAAETTAVGAAGVGGPLLPPLPEPEPPAEEPEPQELPEAVAAPEPDKAEAAGAAPVVTAARIGASSVNVRAGPSTVDARLFGLDPGEQVMAIESSDGWLKIEDAAGRTGWVHADLLAATDGDPATATAEPPSEPPAAAPAEAPAAPPAAPASAAPPAAVAEGSGTRTVAGTAVSVRDAPSNSGARLFALAAGEDVTVTGSDKGWLKIVDGRGRTGWAYSDFFKPAP